MREPRSSGTLLHLAPRLSAWLGRLLSHDFQVDASEVAQTLWLTAQEAAEHRDALPYHRDIVAALVAAIAR